MTITAVSHLAVILHRMAHAPREDWQKLAHEAEALVVAKLGLPTPHNLQMMASAAKSMARQMPHASTLNDSEVRGCAQALSNILTNDVSALMAESDVAKRDAKFYWQEQA